jgi:hypothetical protein
MPDSKQPNVPQFDTAQYAPKSGADACTFCKQPVGAAYYRVKGAMACMPCGQKATANLPKDSHADFMRGLLFGVGGAVVGLAIYSTFAIATGLVIGYVSLAVGYIVGKAMKKGSNGAGGQRYQIAAVLLTYAAVSLSAIPIGIHAYMKRHEQAQQVRAQRAQQAAPAATEPDDPVAQNPSPRPAPSVDRTSLLLRLLWLGLASPILELINSPGYGSIIGLVILFVGLRIAWQITGYDPRNEIVGPFANRTANAVSTSAG